MLINIITLGCSKNLVDSEYLLRQFFTNGHDVRYDEALTEADVVILNTCGFILDAKQESIQTILQYADLKKQGKIKKILVMGCLSERYRDDLQKEIPEIDGLFGVWEQQEIIQAIGSKYYQELRNDRLTTTPTHYAFLKISEGCNRVCAFCAIPGIRGKQRSKSIDDLIEEAENLAGRGVKELILIAQDLTAYGTDIYGKKALPDLLTKLEDVNGIDWIRLHYAYPSGFPEEVIRLMADSKKICNYLDIPIQHINSRILKSMNRGHDREELIRLLHAFRSEVPDVAIRTTFMVGYPGETEEEFDELCEFVRDFRFERAGVFPYSEEEGTPAEKKLTDDVPAKVKTERVNRIMDIQQQVSLEINEAKVGKTFRVIVDSDEPDYYIGRTQHDSPEVDNEVLIKKDTQLKIGNFYHVEITSAAEFDLFGKVIIQQD